MAALTNIQFDTGMLSRVRHSFAAFRARRAEYYRVHDELARLTDRDLADIGIDRTEIDPIARQAAGY